MTPNDKPMNERVAVLETTVEDMRQSMSEILKKEDRIAGLLNTICIEMATLRQQVTTIIQERSMWKNPLVWTNLISLGVAIAVLLKR